MNVTKFLAANVVVVLPSKSSPKVYLAIDTPALARMAFELYNPFSTKGKLFKGVALFLCVHANNLAKLILPTLSIPKSPFMVFVSGQMAKELTSSVYIATAKDKVVLQLVENGNIIGYLKYPLTLAGESRLQNEIKGIRILSEKGIVPPLIYLGNYEKMDFIILRNIEGSIEKVDIEEIAIVLNSLKKNVSYPLAEHPRILHLKRKAFELGMEWVAVKMGSLVKQSKNSYAEVYEHGDFAPWNLIKASSGLVPFDFEYFVENGITYFDELKYHYQIAHLLEGKVGKDLFNAVESNVMIEEFHILFGLYLIKEILIKKEEGIPYHLEELLLGYI